MTWTPSQPFAFSSGPKRAKIAIVGEAWGDQEAIAKIPFVGPSGQELTRMLREAGLNRKDCFLTNVLPFQPPGNDIGAISVPRRDVAPDYPMPAIKQGRYLREEYLPELERLRQELYAVAPNLIIAFGNTATWALLRSTRIGSTRGVITEGPLAPGVKVLPTYHPAAILRRWEQRPIVIADLLKAAREATFPEIRRPERDLTISPTLDEVARWANRPHTILAVDTETRRGQIRSVQFARSPREALTIPFWVGAGDYWPTLEQELEAWCWVERLLLDPCPKVFQNGLYDLTYLLRMGFRPRNVADDTMLFHHALYPELQKGLGFMGSLYTNEAAWKLMHRHGETKADE